MKKHTFILLSLISLSYIKVFSQSYYLKPGDDFYSFVNKTWLDSIENTDGPLQQIEKRTQLQLAEILKNNAENKSLKINSAEKKLADFYKSGLDTAILEKRGIEPLLNYFDRIDRTQNISELLNLIAVLHLEGQGHFFGIDVGQDPQNNNYSILYLTQTPPTLGFASVYTEEGDIFELIRNNYKEYLKTIFKLIGKSDQDAESIANDIFTFEHEWSPSFLDDVELYNPDITNNKMSVLELERLTPMIDWSNIIKLMGVNTDSVIVQNPKYILKLNELTHSKSLETWKNKLKAYIILKRTVALNFTFREALVELRSVFTGGKIFRKREAELLSKCNNEILGKLYAEKYFSKKSKHNVSKIAEKVKSAFEIRLSNNNWMDVETKTKALTKLRAMDIKIGFPEKIDEFKTFSVDPIHFFENMDNWSAYEFKSKVSRVGKKIDTDKWYEVGPQEVNAYYDPKNNALVFPAAILQAPLFDIGESEVTLYGSIGYIIGHEMTHGFDNNGRKFNASGKKEDWWTAEDKASFSNLCDRFEKQFSSYKIADSVSINGSLTLAENIADLGGLSLAYDAYKMSKAGSKNDIELDKHFFISFAQVWRQKLSDQEIMNMALHDTHSPPKWRVNGILSNFEPFYKTFNINQHDKLFIRKEERISIW